MIIFFKHIKYNTSVKQIIGLLSANLLGLPLGIITNILVTKYLGPEKFGDYSFILGVFNFAIIFLSFGLFYSSNRAVLLSNSTEKTRRLYGASYIITLFLFLLISFVVVGYALFSTNVHEKGLTNELIISLPIGLILLWSKCFEEVLPSSNQIGILSRIRLYPRVLNLLFAAFVFYYLGKYELNKVLVIVALYGMSQLIIFISSSFRLRVSFSDLIANVKEILNFNKSYGFNVYIGALFASGFSALTEILISQFGSNNTGVGYYSLATTLSMPVLFIPATIATTHYKDFETQSFIPAKLIRATLLISFISIVGLWLVIPPFVYYFYGEAFAPVIRVNFFVSIGVLLCGLADFINRFLCAKGAGKELRNASFIVGFCVMASNLLLIPKWGEYGAAYAKIVSGVILVLTEIYYYKRIISREKTKIHN